MGEIVAVIGGSGFLGRHVVRHLQEEAASSEKGCLQIKEIRVLDIKEFYTNIEIEWEIGDGRKVYLKDDSQCSTYSPSSGSPECEDAGGVCLTPVFQRVNICDRKALVEAMKRVTMVVNCSAVLPDLYHEDFGDKRHMDQVNVQGVDNIVWACNEVQARVLVHVSSILALKSSKRLVDHTESSTPIVPDHHLYLKHYATGRLKAEKIVTEAHDGDDLRTVVLRIALAYGEGDCRFIPRLVLIAQMCEDGLPWIGDLEEANQLIYIGNAAWATVLGLRALGENNSHDVQDVGGTTVYITDDSVPRALPIGVAPFLEPLGITQQPPTEYLWTFRLLAAIYGVIARNGYMNQHHPQATPLTPAIMHILMQKTCVVSRMRASLGLHYEPKYKHEEAIKRANKFYSKITIK